MVLVMLLLLGTFLGYSNSLQCSCDNVLDPTVCGGKSVCDAVSDINGTAACARQEVWLQSGVPVVLKGCDRVPAKSDGTTKKLCGYATLCNDRNLCNSPATTTNQRVQNVKCKCDPAATELAEVNKKDDTINYSFYPTFDCKTGECTNENDNDKTFGVCFTAPRYLNGVYNGTMYGCQPSASQVDLTKKISTCFCNEKDKCNDDPNVPEPQKTTKGPTTPPQLTTTTSTTPTSTTPPPTKTPTVTTSGALGTKWSSFLYSSIIATVLSVFFL